MSAPRKYSLHVVNRWLPQTAVEDEEMENIVVDNHFASPMRIPPASLNVEDATDNVDERPKIRVDRHALSQQSFNATYEAVQPQKKNLKEWMGSRFECTRTACSTDRCTLLLKSVFPIIGWLSNYDVKQDFIPDLVTGITIGIFQVPQGMAYCLLAGVEPVYGLYTSLFPVLIYVLLGTSRHVSVGTFAIVTLMTGTIVRKFSTDVRHDFNETATAQDANDTENLPDEGRHDDDMSPIQVAIVACFVVGGYQIIFGVCRLGFLCTYLSRHLVSGFTTASAFHVFTSQLSTIFGIHLPKRNGALNLIYTYVDFFGSIRRTNYVTLLLSISTIAFLYALKTLTERYKKKMKFPIPGELLVVIAGTLISYYLVLDQTHNVSIVGEVPNGIPPPTIPKLEMIPKLIPECLSLAIISFSITLSISKIYAQKHAYNIDANQELLALGAANVFGCFFYCVPVSGSLSRSAVQDGSGGKTQLVSLVNCIIILVVVLFVGNLLHDLPKCILGSVIVIALKSLLMQIVEFKRYWSVSKIDGMIWLVTFVSTVILDVDIGLGIGVLFSLLTLIFRSQRPKTFLLGRIGNTDVYVPVEKYLAASEIPNVKIFHFGGSLHFANTEFFVGELLRRTGADRRQAALRQKEKEQKSNSSVNTYLDNNYDLPKSNSQIAIINASRSSVSENEEQLPSHVIIDCSGFNFVDSQGAATLKQVVSEYANIGIQIFLAACSGHVYKTLEKDEFFKTVSAKQIFPTINDAILYATKETANRQVEGSDVQTLPLSTHI